jgi:hypothetical protein
MSGSASSSAQLKSLSSLKLIELGKQRAKLESHYELVRKDADDAAASAGGDSSKSGLVAKLKVLSEGLVASAAFASGSSSSSRGSSAGNGFLSSGGKLFLFLLLFGTVG